MKHAVILSITSDIGFDIAQRLSSEGYSITGTYRSLSGYKNVRRALPNANLIECDLYSLSSLNNAVTLINAEKKWNLFISCPCDPLPLKSFYESSIDEWTTSFELNSLSQLKFLHGIYKSLNKDHDPTVMFFAGGGTNNAVDNFSAYTSAKIHLIKMIELLAHEDPQVRYLILGPGWTNTKTHQITLANTAKNSKKYKEVQEFLGDPKRSTPLVDIYECLKWLMSLEPHIVSGRNYSIVHDLWRPNYQQFLVSKLINNSDFYKLRRMGNDVFPSFSVVHEEKDINS